MERRQVTDQDIKDLFMLDSVLYDKDENRYARKPLLMLYVEDLATIEKKIKKNAHGEREKFDRDIYDYLNTRFPELPDPSQLNQRLYFILHGIEHAPTCPICGKPLRFEGLSYGYKRFCSDECLNEYRSRKMTIHEKKPKHAQDITDMSQVTDEYVLKMFFEGKERLKEVSSLVNTYNMYARYGKATKHSRINVHVYNYLVSRFNDTDNITETLYRLKNNIDKTPLCPNCGKPLRFEGLYVGYLTYCSRECEHEYTLKKIANRQEAEKKVREEKLSTLYKEETGKDVDDSVIIEMINKYGQRHVAATYSKYERNYISKQHSVYKDVYEYLVNRYYDSDSISETLYRIKNSIEERPVCEVCGGRVLYIGKHNNMWGRYCSNQCKYEANSKNLIQGCNGTCNTASVSNEEKRIESILRTNGINVETQYKSEVYPFFCDMYVKDLDLYIEYQGYFAHGQHPYRNNDEDREHIENVLRFKGAWAVERWTEIDVKKRRIAKENNLNYLELWPKDRGVRRMETILNGIKSMYGKSKEEIQQIIKDISLYETIYDDDIYLG